MPADDSSASPTLRLTRSAFDLPRATLRRLVGEPVFNHRGAQLEVSLQALLVASSAIGERKLANLTPELARSEMLRDTQLADLRPRAMAAVDPLEIPPPAGGKSVPVRVYRPRLESGPWRRELPPLLVYFHGGGYVTGSPDSHDGLCRTLAEVAGCVLASVDYRLAPEHPFPAAIDDGCAAFEHLRAQARELGVDPQRVAIGGDSAGGNLAALVCHRLRARDQPQPWLQCLLYPATDLRYGAPSHHEFAEGFMLSRDKLAWYNGLYLDTRERVHDPAASPLLAEDFSGLAPAIVRTAGFDPLRDEGLAYSRALAAAGVPVDHRCHERLIHGFYSMGGLISAAREAVLDLGDVLRDALHGQGVRVTP
ncbi:Esterase/lipase/thioesterase [Plesiocystis pacifica SIR-1]|uniref:Esterase/lipase/thioesterase n=1 Tax=Plesiocystis pacifica SIR-1 TaxID=391625 RepID=A6GCW9_9BACT|nr:alpha/beta hydrolase [Plesiocystis pacifica]EDM76293.1 Esterase/lipase/thioesterase [Plesiocystis pacifica SIR-1]